MSTPTTDVNAQVVKTESSLEMRRVFNATRQQLFKAWTDPNVVAKWFHPAEPMTTTVSELALEEGGRYRFIMHGDSDFVIGGVYKEIVPLEKLVFTWQWEHEAETPETLITLQFNEVDSGHTELVLLHERHSSVEERDNHEWGWHGTLDELARLFA